MARIAARLTNERREQVWKLMITGSSPQQIIKTLRTTQTVIYNDIKFLSNESEKYIFQMAKGGLALQYKKSLDGINYVISQCCRELNDAPPKLRPSYYRLLKDCYENMTQLASNYPSIIAMQNITRRAESLGVNVDVDFNNADINNNQVLTEGR